MNDEEKCFGLSEYELGEVVDVRFVSWSGHDKCCACGQRQISGRKILQRVGNEAVLNVWRDYGVAVMPDFRACKKCFSKEDCNFTGNNETGMVTVDSNEVGWKILIHTVHIIAQNTSILNSSYNPLQTITFSFTNSVSQKQLLKTPKILQDVLFFLVNI